MVAAGGLAAGVAAVGHVFGVVAGLITALLWLGLLGLNVARAPGGRLAGHRGALAANGIGVALGVAAGVVLGRAFPPSDVIGGVGFAAGLCVVFVALTWSWRARARRWRDALGIDDVVRAAGGLTGLVITAANREWSALAMQQDALIRVKSAIEGVASELRVTREKIDRDWPALARG